MKKLQHTLPALMLILMFSLTGLAGCQLFSNQQPQQGDIDQMPRDRRIGVIQSLGSVKTSSQGTNLLMMDDGTTILLKSLAINLDDSKYAGKKVEVSGLLTYTTGDNKQIMEVESIDVLDDAPVVTQQAAAVSWRDYVNAGLGFTLKYRDDFVVDDANGVVSFTRQVSPNAIMMSDTEEASSSMERVASHSIMISASTHGPDETLLNNVLHLPNDNASTLISANVSKSKIGLNGINAYKKVSPEKSSVDFYFDADGRFYHISFVGGSDSQSIEDQNVFYNLLASFQLMSGSSSTQEAEVDDTVNNVLPEKKPESSLTPASGAGTTGVSSSTGGSVGSAMTTSSEDFSDTAPTADSPTSSTATPSGSASGSAGASSTQELLPGYSSFTSSGYKFSLQYPKSWYYGQTSTTETNVIRRYDFGSKPVDEQPGSVNLDIMSGSAPAGTSATVGGKTVTKVSDGATTSYYYKGDNGRLYRVSGPSGMDASLQTMVETLQEQ